MKIYSSKIYCGEQIDKETKCFVDLLEEKCMGNTKNIFGRIENGEINYLTADYIYRSIRSICHFLVQKQTKKIIGIFSKNRSEWVVSDYGIQLSGNISCPIYATFGLNALKLILEETEMKCCFASAEEASMLLEIGESKLEQLVLFEKDEELHQTFLNKGIEVFYFEDLLQIEGTLKGDYSMDDLASICYTSGTTSNPKGVMLTHKNFVSPYYAYRNGIGQKQAFEFNSSDVYYSYLPLAHILERQLFIIMIMTDAIIIFGRNNVKKISEDMRIAKPTFFSGVPRVFDVIRSRVYSKIQSRYLATKLFNFCLGIKEILQPYEIFSLSILDTLVFKKIRDEFGGRINKIFCGSAIIKPELIRFIQAAFSCPLLQGYGLTETSAIVTFMPTNCSIPGTVGIPFSNCKIKLVGDSPGIGEMYVKGSNVFRGYFKNKELTDKVLTEDGWFKTGDLFKFSDGLFYFLSRVGDNFKTSHGEYIIPTKIESLLRGDEIQDIFITGRSDKSYVCALIVSPDDSAKNKEILEKKLQDKAKILLKEKKIVKFEIPKKIHIITKPFHETRGLVTESTLKVIRKKVEEYYVNVIEEMLAEE